MTAGNNGASKPEDDDPFGYLYEDGQAAGAHARGQGGYGYPGPAAQPGVPRTSYHQVRTVGERQYGQHVPHQQTYGQPPQAPYGRPHPQHAAPRRIRVTAARRVTSRAAGAPARAAAVPTPRRC
ncbi:hypothetical protein Sfulv_33760 [Streptomyces fulvorobeus]|uniref:Uncharacterized protein n=1 Tax=Streptomyces fulvorobeus TaxID=284028 RepID=A0A7J0C7Q5_9ACTN|nr:hypothetical protein Sfulv_33760 [Streptomyces fulvorobeus]